MSDEAQSIDDEHDESIVDALAAIAIVVIPVIGVVYWLSGL